MNVDPRLLSASYGLRAWAMLRLARDCRRDASRAGSHEDAERLLQYAGEYVRLARTWNHRSIRARERLVPWNPPVLRALEAA